MKNNQTVEWNGLRVVGDIVDDDWEGDASVPNGIHEIPAYVQDLEVYAAEDTSIVDYLNDEGVDFFCGLLLENAEGDDEPEEDDE